MCVFVCDLWIFFCLSFYFFSLFKVVLAGSGIENQLFVLFYIFLMSLKHLLYKCKKVIKCNQQQPLWSFLFPPLPLSTRGRRRRSTPRSWRSSCWPTASTASSPKLRPRPTMPCGQSWTCWRPTTSGSAAAWMESAKLWRWRKMFDMAWNTFYHDRV